MLVACLNGQKIAYRKLFISYASSCVEDEGGGKTFKQSLASSSAAAVEKLLRVMIYIFSTGVRQFGGGK